jgi:hypothetical protein
MLLQGWAIQSILQKVTLCRWPRIAWRPLKGIRRAHMQGLNCTGHRTRIVVPVPERRQAELGGQLATRQRPLFAGPDWRGSELGIRRWTGGGGGNGNRGWAIVVAPHQAGRRRCPRLWGRRWRVVLGKCIARHVWRRSERLGYVLALAVAMALVWRLARRVGRRGRRHRLCDCLACARRRVAKAIPSMPVMSRARAGAMDSCVCGT